jgi:hypothetical protein
VYGNPLEHFWNNLELILLIRSTYRLSTTLASLQLALIHQIHLR